MNNSGDRVAVGAPRTNSYMGRVTIYHLVDGAWLRLGQHIDCMETSAYSGAAISMDGSGNRLVIGGRLGSYYFGFVKVYDYDVNTSQWVLNGHLEGEDYYDRFGSAVDICESGNRIVIGAYTSDGQSEGRHDAGEFYVVEYDGSAWNTIGQKVVGTTEMDKSGESVSISGDGTHILISSPGSDDGLENAGKAVVYKYSEAEDLWVQQAEVSGGNVGDKFGEGGTAVALDRTGAHFAVGAMRGNYYAGMALVYKATFSR